MSQVVIGTAGHIDHGKTTLVKALTGTDTDRLPEEKERGMTIDLGFAFLTDEITIIDVPGHEKFIRNMVAGVSAVDIALVTIAADDGIMPQTREHIDILRLLGVKSGCVALTKIDLVNDADWLDLLEEDIREYIKGSFLENAPIMRVSGETGEGVEELRAALLRLAGETVEKEDRGFFRLFVDRAFSIKGFGTVVTGTVVSGSLKDSDEVEILPGGGLRKVRGLQSHGKSVTSVALGDRAAVNLSHVERSSLRRGSQLITPGFIQPTSAVGAEITAVVGTKRSIRHEQRVRVHVGTDEVMGRVLLVKANQKKPLRPGQSAVALIRLESTVPVAMDDPLILRFYSPAETIGGGVIIDTHPPTRWKASKQWLGSLAGLDPQERFRRYLESTVKEPLTVRGWCQRWQVTPTGIHKLAEKLDILEFGSENDPYLTLRDAVGKQKESYLRELHEFHSDFAYKKGITREDLRQRLGFSPRLFAFLTEQLENEDQIDVRDGLIGLHGFRVELSERDRRKADRVEKELKRAHFKPPSVAELSKLLQLSESDVLQIMHMLKGEEKAVELDQGFWFHTELVTSLEQKVRSFLSSNSSMAVSDFKKLTATTRKHAIPLLEYLDHHHVTKREGDRRVLY